MPSRRKPSNINDILREYDQKRPVYKRFALEIETLLEKLLVQAELPVLTVHSRVKSRVALETKLMKPDAHYNTLADVTDVSGVRVICFFSDDADEVEAIIRKEFDVDDENSVDKRKLIAPDKFGYLSVHHIVSLSADRAKLSENLQFQGMKLEIQTRSILQHAWAEIEHDLGYKSKVGIPTDARRSFSRVAGMLETADRDFNTIRRDLNQRDKHVSAHQELPPDEPLDLPSLKVFIMKERLVKTLDREISNAERIALLDTVEDAESPMQRLEKAGLKTIGEVRQLLNRHRRTIVRLAHEILTLVPFPEGGRLAPGTCLLVVAYIAVLESGQDRDIEALLKVSDTRLTAEQLREAFKRIESLPIGQR